MNLFDNINGSKQAKSIIDLLDQYKKTLTSYQAKIEKLEITEEDQMAAVQVALDLTYLKEELDMMRPSQDRIVKDMQSMREILENDIPLIREAQIKDRKFLEMAMLEDKRPVKEVLERLDKIGEEQGFLRDKIAGIDTDIIEPIKSDYTTNRNAVTERLDEVLEVVQNGTRKIKMAFIISLLLNIITISGLVFSMLYTFGILG